MRNFSREEKSRVYTLVLAWLYILGIILLLQGRSSIFDVVLVGGIYKEALLGCLPHEGFPG